MSTAPRPPKAAGSSGRVSAASPPTLPASERQRPLALRVLIVIGGFGLLGAGVLLLVLPGPGLLVIAGGLGLLSLEFSWAARLRRSVVARMERVTPRDPLHRRIGLAVVVGLAVAGTLLAVLYGMPSFMPVG